MDEQVVTEEEGKMDEQVVTEMVRCPVEGCAYEGSKRGLPIHLGKCHPDYKGGRKTAPAKAPAPSPGSVASAAREIARSSRQKRADDVTRLFADAADQLDLVGELLTATLDGLGTLLGKALRLRRLVGERSETIDELLAEIEKEMDAE